MSAIARIRTRLAEYPQVRFVESPSSIEVQPESDSGFAVSLYVEGRRFTVHFEAWHEHFDSEQKALDCFAFGLSSACRLRVTYHGSTPTRWTVEAREQGRWRPESETGLIFIPFWRRRRIVYLQNRLFPSG